MEVFYSAAADICPGEFSRAEPPTPGDTIQYRALACIRRLQSIMAEDITAFVHVGRRAVLSVPDGRPSINRMSCLEDEVPTCFGDGFKWRAIFAFLPFCLA